jgi:hypothetical protein
MAKSVRASPSAVVRAYVDPIAQKMHLTSGRINRGFRALIIPLIENPVTSALTNDVVMTENDLNKTLVACKTGQLALLFSAISFSPAPA